ncbi:Trafficking protein particle complex subunit 12 [Kappamyces sp. JEL0680]|nr:Trafficking protein particle complex subunit 12 [Kappamyces sp. JEL0680]
MRLWSIRWSALIQLRQFDIVQTEMDKLKATDLQEMCYENYPDVFGTKKGTMVSFDILLLMATLDSHKGNHHDAIHRLFKLVYPVNAWDFHPSADQHVRILLHVVSVLVKIPDYVLALKLAGTVSAQYPENVDLLSMIGRLHLQIGDLDSAEALFMQVEQLLGLPPSVKGSDFSRLPNTFPRPDLVLSQRAFLLFAQDKINNAMEYFTELLTLMPESDSAINNLAMCHLYCGNVGQGSSFLESFMVTHPTFGGKRPELLFNLASMYDLSDSSLAKKRALLKVIIRGCGDDFDPNSLKL